MDAPPSGRPAKNGVPARRFGFAPLSAGMPRASAKDASAAVRRGFGLSCNSSSEMSPFNGLRAAPGAKKNRRGHRCSSLFAPETCVDFARVVEAVFRSRRSGEFDRRDGSPGRRRAPSPGASRPRTPGRERLSRRRSVPSVFAFRPTDASYLGTLKGSTKVRFLGINCRIIFDEQTGLRSANDGVERREQAEGRAIAPLDLMAQGDPQIHEHGSRRGRSGRRDRSRAARSKARDTASPEAP